MLSLLKWRLVISGALLISCFQILRSIRIEPYVEEEPSDISHHISNGIVSTTQALKGIEHSVLDPSEVPKHVAATIKTHMKTEAGNNVASKVDRRVGNPDLPPHQPQSSENHNKSISVPVAVQIKQAQPTRPSQSTNQKVEGVANKSSSIGAHQKSVTNGDHPEPYNTESQSLGSLESLNQTQSSPLSQTTLEMPIDANSTIVADLSKIWHDPEKGSVCVQLKENARCPHPALLGRLSGPALAILDWNEQKTEEHTGTVLCGDYSNKWLDAAEYFVEIIVLYCEDFGVGAMERVNNETIWMGAGFKKKCIEDAMYNRITAKEGSKINITSSTEGKGTYRLGRWVRRAGIPLRPLFTRYQPVGCTDPKKGYKVLQPLPEWCEPFTRRDKPDTGKYLWRSKKGATTVGLPEYEFQWRMTITEVELIERLRKRLRDKSKRLPKICAIGDSHSRMMEERSLPQLNLTGIFDFIQSYWVAPRKIGPKVVTAQCEKIFVQIGQWAPSWYTKGQPFSFAKYHKKMKQHVENALKVLENKTDAKIYLPTIDQGPLMGRVNACNDWRTPTVLDGYSRVLQIIERDLAVNTSKVEYIDTNFIISTHWDGHPDWAHLLEDVRYRKTIYIVALILGELS
mmetsp:Transcript_34301/g.83231  ORF Transcript_34301/g.83231 Transcript_34301/m.83231 type:complete len:627 (-) Transcript_34301:279-2159(-)